MDVPSALTTVAITHRADDSHVLRAFWQSTQTALIPRTSSPGGLLDQPGSFLLVLGSTATLGFAGGAADRLAAVAYVRFRAVHALALRGLDGVPFSAHGSAEGREALTVVVSRAHFRLVERIVSKVLPQLRTFVSALVADPRFVDADVRNIAAARAAAPPGSLHVETLPRVTAAAPPSVASRSVVPDIISTLTALPYFVAFDGAELVIVCRDSSFPEENACFDPPVEQGSHVVSASRYAPDREHSVAQARTLVLADAADGSARASLRGSSHLGTPSAPPLCPTGYVLHGGQPATVHEHDAWMPALLDASLVPQNALRSVVGGRPTVPAARSWWLLGCCQSPAPPSVLAHVARISLKLHEGCFFVSSTAAMGLTVPHAPDYFRLLFSVLRRAGILDTVIRAERDSRSPSRAAVALAFQLARADRKAYDVLLNEDSPQWMLSVARLAPSPDFLLHREALEQSLSQPTSIDVGSIGVTPSRAGGHRALLDGPGTAAHASNAVAGSSRVVAIKSFAVDASDNEASGLPNSAAAVDLSTLIIPEVAQLSALQFVLSRLTAAAAATMPAASIGAAGGRLRRASVGNMPHAMCAANLVCALSCPVCCSHNLLLFTQETALRSAPFRSGRRSAGAPLDDSSVEPAFMPALNVVLQGVLVFCQSRIRDAVYNCFFGATPDSETQPLWKTLIVTTPRASAVPPSSPLLEPSVLQSAVEQPADLGSSTAPVLEASVVLALRATLGLAAPLRRSIDDARGAAGPLAGDCSSGDEAIRSALSLLSCLASSDAPFLVAVPVPVHCSSGGTDISTCSLSEALAVHIVDHAARSVAEAGALLSRGESGRSVASKTEPIVVDAIAAALLLQACTASVSQQLQSTPGVFSDAGVEVVTPSSRARAQAPASSLRRAFRRNSSAQSTASQSFTSVSVISIGQGPAAVSLIDELAVTAAVLLARCFPALTPNLPLKEAIRAEPTVPALIASPAAVGKRVDDTTQRSHVSDGGDSAATGIAGGLEKESIGSHKRRASDVPPAAPPRIKPPPPPLRVPADGDAALRNASTGSAAAVPPINLGKLAHESRASTAGDGLVPDVRQLRAFSAGHDSEDAALKTGDPSSVWGARCDSGTAPLSAPAVQWATSWPPALAALVGILVGWSVGLHRPRGDGKSPLISQPASARPQSVASQRGAADGGPGDRGIKGRVFSESDLVYQAPVAVPVTASVSAAATAAVAYIASATWTALQLRASAPRDPSLGPCSHAECCSLCSAGTEAAAVQVMISSSELLWKLFTSSGEIISRGTASLPIGDLFVGGMRALYSNGASNLPRAADSAAASALRSDNLPSDAVSSGSPLETFRLAPLVGLITGLAGAGFLASLDRQGGSFALPPASLCVRPGEIDTLLRYIARATRLPRVHLSHPTGFSGSSSSSTPVRDHALADASALRSLRCADISLRAVAVLAWSRCMQGVAGDVDVLRAGLRAVIVWHRLVSAQPPVALLQLFERPAVESDSRASADSFYINAFGAVASIFRLSRNDLFIAGASMARFSVGLLRSALVRMPGEKASLVFAESPPALFPPPKQLLGLPAFILTQRWLMLPQLDALVPCVSASALHALRPQRSSLVHASIRHAHHEGNFSLASPLSANGESLPLVSPRWLEVRQELGERMQACELAISACGRGFDEVDELTGSSDGGGPSVSSKMRAAGRSVTLSQGVLTHVIVACGLHLQLARLLSLEARARETWMRLQEEEEEEQDMDEEGEDGGDEVVQQEAAEALRTEDALSVVSEGSGPGHEDDESDDDDDFIVAPTAIPRVAVDPVTGMPLQQQTRVVEVISKAASVATLPHSSVGGVIGGSSAPGSIVLATSLEPTGGLPDSATGDSSSDDALSPSSLPSFVPAASQPAFRLPSSIQQEAARNVGAFVEEEGSEDSDDDGFFEPAPRTAVPGVRIEVDPVTGVPLRQQTRVISLEQMPPDACPAAPGDADAAGAIHCAAGAVAASPPAMSQSSLSAPESPGPSKLTLRPVLLPGSPGAETAPDALGPTSLHGQAQPHILTLQVSPASSQKGPVLPLRSTSTGSEKTTDQPTFSGATPVRRPAPHQRRISVSGPLTQLDGSSGKGVPSLFLPKSTKKGILGGFALLNDRSQPTGTQPSRAASFARLSLPGGAAAPPVVVRIASFAQNSIADPSAAASPAHAASPSPLHSIPRRGRSQSLCMVPPNSSSPPKSRPDALFGPSAVPEGTFVEGATRRRSVTGPAGSPVAAALAVSIAEGQDNAEDVGPSGRLLFEDGEYGAPPLPLQQFPLSSEEVQVPSSARSVHALARNLAAAGAIAVADFSRRGSIMAGPLPLAALPSAYDPGSLSLPQTQRSATSTLAAAPVEWTVTDKLAVALVASSAASGSDPPTHPSPAIDASVASLSNAFLEPKLRQSRRRLILATVLGQSSSVAAAVLSPGGSAPEPRSADRVAPVATTSGPGDTDGHHVLQRAPTFLLQRLALGRGNVKPLSYLEAYAASPLYSDPELHARAIMLLFSCMLTQEGTALREAVVTREVRASTHLLHEHRRGSPAGLATDLSFSGAWGDGVFEGFAVTARRPSTSTADAASGVGAAVATAGSRHALVLSRAAAGPLREADRGGSSATLQRFLSGKSFRAAGSSLRRLAGSASSVPSMAVTGAGAVSAPVQVGSFHHAARNRSHHQLHQPLDAGHAADENPWDGLEAHPVYVLQCHLNHPANTVLVNVQLRRLCVARGRAYMRLLRLLSLEFFVPAQYELQGHIASGAYGSVMAALAARESPAAALLSIISAIMRTAFVETARPASMDFTHRSALPSPSPLLRSTNSLQRLSSPERAFGAAALSVPDADGAAVTTAVSPPSAAWQRAPSGVPGAPSPSPSGSSSTPSRDSATAIRASGVGASAPTASALRLSLPTDEEEDGGGGRRDARKSMSGEVTVAVKVVTSPEDMLERCALADILTEVAIMDDVTTLFVQAAAAAIAARTAVQPAGSSGGEAEGPYSASARAPVRPHHQLSWSGSSRQQSVTGSSDAARSVLQAADGCPTVCLLDFGITTGATWIVQECCAMSLRRWRVEKLNSDVFGSPKARLQLLLDVFACVVHRIAALHALGVTHYDIKCDNVLLRESWASALSEYVALQQQQQRPPLASPAVVPLRSARSGHSSLSTLRGGGGSAGLYSGGASGLSRSAAVLLPSICLADFGESDFTPHVHAASRPMVPGRGTECVKAPEQLRAAYNRAAPRISTTSSAGSSPRRSSARDGSGVAASAATGAAMSSAKPVEAGQQSDVASSPPPDQERSSRSRPRAQADWSSGAACDVWSAGCLLFELLTGSFLFDSEDWARFFVTVTGAQLSGDAPVGSEATAASNDLPLLSDAAEGALEALAGGTAAAGTLRRLLLGILQRDPRQRPSALAALELVQDAAAQLQSLG